MTGLPLLTAGQMRAAEARAMAEGVTVETLMDAAGEAVARIVAERWPGRDVLIACGPGNNGGDGYVAARRLREQGVAVRVAAPSPPRSPAAIAARDGWGGPVEAFDAAGADAAVLVDALFGTGLQRPLGPDLAAFIGRHGREARLAVDLPSGVSTDDGAVLGAVARFDVTVALGFLKPAHRLRPAADRCGDVVLAPIGLVPGFLPPCALIDGEPGLVSIERPRLAAPDHDANKYSRGKVVVLGGAMAGAAMLAASAAQRSGAGYVELRGVMNAGGLHALVRQPWVADALEDRRIGALVCGPGLGHDAEAAAKLEAALASPHPLVLDADALTMVAKSGLERVAAREAPVLLTPHEGEFVRLFGEVGEDRLGAVRKAARKAGALVLLKGAATIIAHPDGRAAIAPLASPWLASAGTGDVLSGVLATMLAQGKAAGRPAFASAQAAVWLHAEAARLAGVALIADDLVVRLPQAVAACL